MSRGSRGGSATRPVCWIRTEWEAALGGPIPPRRRPGFRPQRGEARASSYEPPSAPRPGQRVAGPRAQNPGRPRPRECSCPPKRGSRERGHCHAVLPTRKPNSLRRAAMLWRRPCGGTHFEIFRRKKFKILGQFPLLLSFPMGHGTSPPHSSGPSHTEPSPHPQGSPGIPAPTRRACPKAPSARRGRAMVVLKPGAGPPRHGTAGRPRHSRRSKVGKNRVTTPSRTEQL